MMSWVVAVNPAAGARPVEMDRLRRALAEAGVEATIEVPPSIDAMRRLIADAVSAPRLAVVGGDGTVNLAVNALFETGAARLPVLGVLPAGSGCDLLRTFGIPNDLTAAAAHLATEQVYPIDVGELSGSWGVRRFVNVAQAGVGAAAVDTSRGLPRRFGSNRYVIAFGVRLPRFPRTEVELITERRTFRGPALAVIMANAQFFAGGWNIAPKATLVDGLFDLQVIDAAKPSAPALVPKLVKGLHLTEKGVRRLTASEFRLETRHVWPLETDGEPVGNTPVEGRVLPAAIDLKI